MQNSVVKVLIIEDHHEQARLMQLKLQHHNSPFLVEMTNTGEKGLDILGKNPFDVIVLDYSLPKKNGLEILKIIKKRKIPIPVIMVTGQGDERIAVEAMREGAHDYLVKRPDTMDLLPQVLLRAISEKRLSSQLEQSEQRYFALFEMASIAIFIIEADSFKILNINKMTSQLLDASNPAILGKTFLDFCSPRSQKNALAALNRILKNDHSNFDTVLLVTSNKRIIPTDISGSLVNIGNNSVIQLFVRDITEKIKMQRQILLSRRRLISLFDGITDLISVQDDRHNLIMGNKKYIQITSKTINTLTGEKCYKALFGRNAPCLNCPAPETYRTGESKFIEIFHKGRTFHIWTFPMSGLDDKPEFIVEYAKDVTEQKEIEKQLIKSEKLASIGLLSSGIAHELRNPLNVIETVRYTIEDSLGAEYPDIMKKLETIKKNIRRASNIIENLLQFSRHSDFEREKIDVERLVDTTLSLLQKEIDVRKIKIEKKYQKIPKVFFSIDSLKQVFLNIIMNAVQAMPKGGLLKINTYLSEDEQWAFVSFIDNGIGISDENIKHIFTPFFSTKKATTGTGLGLYLSYSIIKREGGDIMFKSKQDVGSNFTVKLPVAKNSDVAV
ncbi:response regulator [candidate division KSB1 bacterium]|nr:response regulator [candidate division KSB1 bacterium]